MSGFCQILGLFFWMASIPACVAAKSATHETNGLLLVAIGAILFVGGAIVGELQRLHAPPAPPPASLRGPGDIDQKQRRLSRFFGLR